MPLKSSSICFINTVCKIQPSKAAKTLPSKNSHSASIYATRRCKSHFVVMKSEFFSRAQLKSSTQQSSIQTKGTLLILDIIRMHQGTFQLGIRAHGGRRGAFEDVGQRPTLCTALRRRLSVCSLIS